MSVLAIRPPKAGGFISGQDRTWCLQRPGSENVGADAFQLQTRAESVNLQMAVFGFSPAQNHCRLRADVFPRIGERGGNMMRATICRVIAR
jgi:hypothetical protein